MRRLLLLLLLCCVTLPGMARDLAHPRIGLVLSGGGARGAAHVGVLKVLEELHIPISAVAGTSMGALVGGVYAGGMAPAEMQRRLTGVNWAELLLDDPPRQEWPIRRKQRDVQTPVDLSFGVRQGKLRLPGGALAGQQVEVFFSDLVKGVEARRGFDDLPIPFRAVATNLENGAMKVFAAGPLPEVMRASMSVPGVFAPVEIDDHLYVDGGLVRNLPVDVARRMGVDIVIAVNLGGSYLPRDQLHSVVGVMAQMLAILTEQNVERSLKELRPHRDILIAPDLGTIGAADFTRVAEAIRAGEQAARAVAPRLRHLGLSPADYAAWRARRSLPATDEAPVAQVEIRGLERVAPALFAPLAAHQQGHPLERERLKADLRTLYARSDFTNLNYDLDPLGSANRLVIRAHEKPWGPGYFSFGLGLSSDFKGDERFGLRGTYRRTWVNPLGAEWLTSAQFGNVMGLYTEFFQPFAVDRSTFVVPSLGLGSTPLGVFRDGTRIARYDVLRASAGLDVGATLFGGNAELRLGLALGTATPKRDTGEPILFEGTRNESGPRASLRYDTLDSPELPRQGNRVVLELRAPEPALGADLSYRRALGQWIGAYSIGDHTLVGRAEVGRGFGETMPYYDQFALGGFLHLSGYANDELRGNEVAFGALAYYRRLPTLTPSWARGVYLGGSLEVGSVTQTNPLLTPPGTRFGSSLFLGIDTLIGPAYLGLGMAGDGDGTGYLMIGFP
ncbi:patatin-like phospholipase family protein [Candidatus Thiodictyon syntrophicum]|jgi:NTE family protein|uniref:Patatin n=1 Tax=Candidatus Thiodictyon syntrophicum TaxID=1166950 RepID=A0A2K8U918_9GAMM|nr:patatin-like phospholipase family protein [Candidatus Thiodictyon syntrophicum]AUB81909.1 patatin [Candidatus Thiodictyon syntrophicum]